MLSVQKFRIFYIAFFVPIYRYFLSFPSLAVLEGIAISSDPNYKVLGSTYPWIAKKVLTDSSPQLKSSLQALLYKVHYTDLGSFLFKC